MKKNGLPYNKDSGFQVPKNYFENFEARMMERVSSSELPKKENPFQLPDHYFENLESRILKRIDTQEKQTKVVPLFTRRALSYVAGVAAVLAVIFSSVIFTDANNLEFSDLDVVALENYLLESLDHENPKHSSGEDYKLTTSANPDIDKEALLEYLNDHIEEPALLLNED